MKDSIVVYYGIGATILYAEEAWKRGMEFIDVIPNYYKKEVLDEFKELVEGRPVKYVFLKGDGSKDEDIIDEIRKENVVCAAIGTEWGVRHGDEFFKILGIRYNDPATTLNRVTKKGMDSALKKAGIRRIMTATVTSEDEVRAFWKKNKLTMGFMKLSENAATLGSKICCSLEEAIAHFKVLREMDNTFGRKSDVLIQEYIGGTEYIVNTISYEGKHAVTDIWRYKKINTIDNDVVYDIVFLMSELEPEMFDLINYVYKVLDATGFEYGVCHGEYKIDEKGPVLIETNARIMGPHQPTWYLDEILPHHFADIVVDSFTDPETFEKRISEPYHIKKNAAHKCFVLYDELNANIYPADLLLRRLKSFRMVVNGTIENKKKRLKKTVDFLTTPFILLLNNDNVENLLADIEFVHHIEENIDIICDKKLKPTVVKTDLEEIAETLPKNEITMVVTNNGTFMSAFGRMEKMAVDKNDKYDNIIYACTDCGTLTETYEKFFSFTDKVRSGGMIIMVPEFINRIPCGTKGIQILSHVAECKVLVPKLNEGHLMKAIKN